MSAVTKRNHKELSGGCLCGAVRFTALDVPGTVGACHCAMCRRWTGGPMLAVEPNGGVRIEAGEDDLRWYDSSGWAQRGFCIECGASLFYRLKDDGRIVPAAGALDDQSAFESLGIEIFVDEQPGYYRFAGDRRRLTGSEAIAMYTGDAATEKD